MKKILSLMFIFGVVGCNPAAQYSVLEAGMPTFDGLRSVHGKLVVESRAGRDITVENATIVLRYKDKELANARLMLPIVVPADTVLQLRWDFALETESVTAFSTLGMRLLTNPGQFTVDVSGWVRRGCIRKKVELKNVPVMQLFANFAL